MTGMNRSTVAPPSKGRTLILTAALHVIGGSGFEGLGLRQIADQAGVLHQLVVYHFKSKDALWREVVASIFVESRQELDIAYWAERATTVGPAQALREMFHAFATFTARHPEFHRLLSFEGQVESERLNWLLETYVRPYYEISTAAILAAQQLGV